MWNPWFLYQAHKGHASLHLYHRRKRRGSVYLRHGLCKKWHSWVSIICICSMAFLCISDTYTWSGEFWTALSAFKIHNTIISIYQPTNAHIVSHKTLLKHFKTLRHVSICQIIIRELSSLLKLCYSIHNSIRICKRGVVAAYHVV